MDRLRINVLGPLELSYGSSTIGVPGRKQRTVLAALAARVGSVVSVDTLVTDVWGDSPPDGAEHSLQQHVSTLRKLIADVGHPDSAIVLVRRAPGYVLDHVEIDSQRFETQAQEASSAAAAGRDESAVDAWNAALALWRGHALIDASDSPRLAAAATRLESMRLTVMESRFDTLLRAGQAARIVPELEAAVADHRLHEPFHGQLMTALYLAGRQADALAAYRAARELLIEELGIEPNADLQALEGAILRQSLELPQPTTTLAADLFETFRAESAQPAARLVFADGQAVFLLEGHNVVGRDLGAHVRLLDSRVSRRHAEIVCDPLGARVIDLGSTNGTSVNAVRVQESELNDHDILDFGGVKVTFRQHPDQLR